MKKEGYIKPPMPEFKANIPEHLVDTKNQGEWYVMNQVSILRQQNSWQALMIEQIHESALQTQEDLKELQDTVEDNKEKLLIDDELKKQDKEFQESTVKWKKIGFYTFVGVLYPLYLVMLQQSDWVKTFLDGLKLWAK